MFRGVYEDDYYSNLALEMQQQWKSYKEIYCGVLIANILVRMRGMKNKSTLNEGGRCCFDVFPVYFRLFQF